MKKTRKLCTLFLCFTVAMLLLAGCEEKSESGEETEWNNEKQQMEVQKKEGNSCFPIYTRGFSTKDTLFQFRFYCDRTDRERWTQFNIESVYLKVADYRQKMYVKMIQFDDEEEITEDGYFAGVLVLDGNVQKACAGAMSLLVTMRDTEKEQEFPLGECSVVTSTETGGKKDVIKTESAVVAKPDKDGNIITYGNVVHIKTRKDIQIQSIDMAQDSVGLDTEHCKVYSPKEFKKEKLEDRMKVGANDQYTVTDLASQDPDYVSILDEDKEDENIDLTMDHIYKKAYAKQVVPSLNSRITLTLKQGEYYIYFPFQFAKKEVPDVISAVIRISYTTKGKKKEQYVSKASYYFMEWKSDSAIKKLMSE